MTSTEPMPPLDLTDPSLYRREIADVNLRVDLEHDDGLTVEALMIPYGREIEAVDLTERGIVRYRERFDSGSCARAVKAPNRVALTFLHDETLGARLGYGQVFREDREGLRGRFRLYPSNAALARDVLMSSHRAISVGFTSLNPRAGTERDGDLIVRRSVILRHAAAVEAGQYAEATITALRAVQEEQEAEAEEKAARDAEEVEAARRKAEDDELRAFMQEAAASQAELEKRLGIEPGTP